MARAPGRDVREGKRPIRYLWRVVDQEGEILESFVTKIAPLQIRMEGLKAAGRDALKERDPKLAGKWEAPPPLPPAFRSWRG